MAHDTSHAYVRVILTRGGVMERKVVGLVVCMLALVLVLGGTGSAAAVNGAPPTASGAVVDHATDRGALGVKAAGCTAAQPYALQLVAETADEVQYLDDMVACTNYYETQVWLANNSDAVWNVYVRNKYVPLSYPQYTLARAFQGYAQSGGLLPNSSVVLSARPSEVRWLADYGVSAAHAAFRLVVGEITSRIKGAAFSVLTSRTKAGAAVLACTRAVRDWAKVVRESDRGKPTVVTNVLGGVANSGSCVVAASQVILSEQTRLRLSDDLAQVTKTSKVVGRLASVLGYAREASKIGRLLLQ